MSTASVPERHAALRSAPLDDSPFAWETMGMVLRIGSFLLGGILFTSLSGCSGDSSEEDDGGSGGLAGASASGGTAGSSAGQGGRAGAGGVAGSGGAGSGAGGQAGAAGGSGAGQGGAAGGPSAGMGGQGGDGESGAAGAAGAGNGGAPSDRWAACPTSDDYTGNDAWVNTLEVTEGAVYCATFNENRTLKEELAKKALLRIAPGTYRLPPEATANLGLPTCIAHGEDGAGTAVTPGNVGYTAMPIESDLRHSYVFYATASDPERMLGLNFDQLAEGDAPFAFRLDGSGDPDAFDSESSSFVLCQDPTEPCYPDLVFDSCTHEHSALSRHELTLDVGTLVLDLRIGMSVASTEPGAFVRAAGTFRGQSFEQLDYFKLVYNPEHHHFERHFAVLFDEPIDGACGLEVSGFSSGEEQLPSAYTVDCSLERLDTLTVTDFSLARDL